MKKIPVSFFVFWCILMPHAYANETVSQQVEGFSLSGQSKDGVSEWTINGDYASLGAAFIDLEGVQAEERTGSERITLTARQAQLDKATQHIALSGDVEVVSSQGYTITTDTLDWQADSEQLTTSSRVRVQHARLVSVGLGATAKPREHAIRFDKDITVTLGDNETVITCNGPLALAYQAGLAQFYDNVHIRDARGTMKADSLDVYLNTTDQSITSLVATGNVIIHHGQSISYSTKAVYDTLTGTMTLEGRPQIIFHPDDMPPMDAMIRGE